MNRKSSRERNFTGGGVLCRKMKHLSPFLSLTVAGLFATSMTLRAEDPLPPKPPGPSTIPAAPSTPSTPSIAAPASGAGENSPKPPGARGDMLQRLKEQLSLTPEQIEKIKPIVEKEREQLKGLKDDAALSQDQKRDKFREIFTASLEEIKPILTQEQLAKLKEAMEKRRAERAKQ